MVYSGVYVVVGAVGPADCSQSIANVKRKASTIESSASHCRSAHMMALAASASCAAATIPAVQTSENAVEAALSPVSALADVPPVLALEVESVVALEAVTESVAFEPLLLSVLTAAWLELVLVALSQLATASAIDSRTFTPRYEQSGSWSTNDDRYGMQSACSEHTSALQSLDDSSETTKQSEGAEDASSIELMVSISSSEQSAARAAGSSSTATTIAKEETIARMPGIFGGDLWR